MINIKNKHRIIRKRHIVEIIFLSFFFLFLSQFNLYAKEGNSYNLKGADSNKTSIKNPFQKANDSEELRDIPNQQVNNQEKKLNLVRNPFTSMQSDGKNGNLILSQNIVFTGIAKVGNENIVFADTNNGLSFLKVGSDLGNGFSISSIDLKESIINISNGILTYKVDFKKR